MNRFTAIHREITFTLRNKSVLAWLLVVACLSCVSVWSGLSEVALQQASIERLLEADSEDRNAQFSHQSDWGSAAYYSFHLTYDPPSDFAFAAMGQRDQQPWKHRIRMLALEGQIYERDVGNPVIALIGRFDFAFLSAFVIPLILILLLYDLKANERIAGRFELLEVTDAGGLSVWQLRAGIRSLAVAVCLLLPLLVAGLVAGTDAWIMLAACAWVAGYVAFWSLLSYWIAGRRLSGTAILMSLVAVWFSTSVIVPSTARLVIDRMILLPASADILLQQRETVNDAWDLPRQATFKPFFERYPQWSGYEAAGDGFEWAWYYAFQQVGDQSVEPLSQAYREGRLRRERLAGWAAWLAPPAMLERQLERLAETDLISVSQYEGRVRAFHGQLKSFYYPRLFENQTFSSDSLDELPAYRPGSAGD